VLAHPNFDWETIAMTFSTNSSRADGLSSEINVTPLIDVLLVMLIIFMMIVPAVPRGLSSTIPSSAPTSADEASARTVLVQVEADGSAVRYVVDGAWLSREDISSRLATVLSKMAVRRVLVKADARLDFATVADVIDAGKVAGAESIGLVTPGMDNDRR
jgi:biopolymer transport protein TolR